MNDRTQDFLLRADDERDLLRYGIPRYGLTREFNTLAPTDRLLEVRLGGREDFARNSAHDSGSR